MARILTGDRPTGPLHVGHLVGSLRPRVALQDKYEEFILIADLHTLTTKPEPDQLAENITTLVQSYLAVGLDPKKVTFFIQSAVPEISELAIILGSYITVNRLQRVPTLKEVMGDLKIAQPSFSLLGYPVLMSADILGFGADLVPVGEDQLAHLEVTREIARRFNQLFGTVFTEPKPHLEAVARLIGTDGQAKMSKSLNNAINLFDPTETVKKKVMTMYTDPQRLHATDPGRVEGNPVFQYHDAFNPDDKEVAELKARYAKGQVGDVEVKERLLIALEKTLAPIREKKEKYRADSLKEIIADGNKKARVEVCERLEKVKDALKLGGDFRD